MMPLNKALGAAALAAAVAVLPARAKSADDESTLVFGVGYADLYDEETDTADFRLDYRHGQGLWFIKPWAGVEATAEGSVWGGAGLYVDVPIYDRVYLTGATSVGAYAQGGGKDLGHVIEFRSQAEVTYRFDNDMRVGAAISHTSNAGLGDPNPGLDVVSAIVVMPLGALIPQ